MSKGLKWLYLATDSEARYYNKLTNLCKHEGLKYHQIYQSYFRLKHYDDKGRLFLLKYKGKEDHFIKNFKFQD